MRKSAITTIVLVAVLVACNVPVRTEDRSLPGSLYISSVPVPKKYSKVFDDLYPDFDSAITAVKNTPYTFLLGSAMIESHCRQFDKQLAAAVEKMLFFGNESSFISLQEILERLSMRLEQLTPAGNSAYEKARTKSLAYIEDAGKLLAQRSNGQEMGDFTADGMLIEKKNGELLLDEFASAVVITHTLASDTELFSQYTKILKLHNIFFLTTEIMTPDMILRRLHIGNLEQTLSSENELRSLYEDVRRSLKYEKSFSTGEKTRKIEVTFSLVPQPFDGYSASLRHDERENNRGIESAYSHQSWQGEAAFFTVEPKPQYYLARARRYRKVRDELQDSLDYAQLRSITLEDTEPAYKKLQGMVSIMYGLYIISSEQSGVGSDIERGELTGTAYHAAKNIAIAWIETVDNRRVFGYDLRDCVKTGQLRQGLKQFGVYTCTFGADLELINVRSNSGQDVVYAIAAPVRAEVRISEKFGAFDEYRFREICAKYANREAIIESLAYGGSAKSVIILQRLFIGLIIIAGALVLYYT